MKTNKYIVLNELTFKKRLLRIIVTTFLFLAIFYCVTLIVTGSIFENIKVLEAIAISTFMHTFDYAKSNKYVFILLVTIVAFLIHSIPIA